MKMLAAKPIKPGMLWECSTMELADRADDDIVCEFLTGCAGKKPGGIALGKPRRGNLGSEADVREQAITSRAMLQIVLNFLLRRPLPRPIDLRFEGKAVDE
jgi:hypothetical protein